MLEDVGIGRHTPPYGLAWHRAQEKEEDIDEDLAAVHRRMVWPGIEPRRKEKTLSINGCNGIDGIAIYNPRSFHDYTNNSYILQL